MDKISKATHNSEISEEKRVPNQNEANDGQDNKSEVNPYKKLFELGIKLSEEIKSVKNELDELYKNKTELSEQLILIKQTLSPISRLKQRIHLADKKDKLSPQDRQHLKIAKEDIINQLILIREQIDRLQQKLKKLVGNEKKELKYKQLKNKSESKRYVNRNKYFIKAKLLAAINIIIKENPREILLKLRGAAYSSSSEGEEFYEIFSDLLDKADPHVYIMCTGVLKKELFNIAKATILNYDLDDADAGEIQELTIPPEENSTEDDESIQSDDDENKNE